MARRDLGDFLGEEPEEDSNGPVETDWAKLRQGVSIVWLKGLLKMDAKTVKKRLASCSPIGKKSGHDVYDPAMALSYLVKPRFDVKDYIKTMNPTELPPMLRKEFWDAENKRANYMERAGELWKTEHVVAVLSDAMKRIKTQLQIWADDVERDAGLNKEQYAALNQRIDSLREDIYNVLVTMPQQEHYGSWANEAPMPDED